jgi:hypothetical protein
MAFLKLDEIYTLLIILGLDHALHRLLLEALKILLFIRSVLYMFCIGHIHFNFGCPYDITDREFYITQIAFRTSLEPLAKIIRNSIRLPQEESSTEYTSAEAHMILDYTPSLLLEAATHYSALRQEVLEWVLSAVKEVRHRARSRLAYAHCRGSLRISHGLIAYLQRVLVEYHCDHLVNNVLDPTFFALSTNIDACPPQLGKVYASLRLVTCELCLQYLRIMDEAKKSVLTKKWRVKTETQKMDGVFVWTNKAIKQSMVRPLEDAIKRKETGDVGRYHESIYRGRAGGRARGGVGTHSGRDDGAYIRDA